MFKGELSAAGGSSLLRNSDKRKLVAGLSSQYAESGVECLFQSKECQYKSGAVVTAKGEKIPLILRDVDPLFFEFKPEGAKKNILVPTVYSMWECPKILKPVVVHQSLLPVLWKGAKLMVPGVMSGLEPGTFKKGDLRALYASNDLDHAVGVGVVVCTTQDVQKRSGPALRMLHLYKDYLWSFGSKTLLPEIPLDQKDDDDDDTEEQGEGEEEDKEKPAESLNVDETTVESDTPNTDIPASESAAVVPAPDVQSQSDEHTIAASTPAAATEVTDGSNQSEAVSKENEQNEGESTCDSAAEPAPTKTPQELMDDLVTTTLYRALKTRIGKDDLPMLASTFYSVHMLPCRPAGTVIDIKKSSYKKLSKLLSAAEAEGVLTIETDKQDIVKILSVNKSHPLLRAVDTSIVSEASLAESAENADDDAANIPLITEFYEVNDLTRFIFEEGTTAVTHQQAVTALMKYIKEKGLDAQLGPNAKKSDTRIDDQIARVTKLREACATYGKREVLDKFIAKMKPFYVINREDLAAGQRKVSGTVPNIIIANERRASNKKVTTISGLQAFRIDLNEVAEELQVICAAAATVQKSKHGTGLSVVVGGTAQKHVTQLLTEKYRVPKKYIVVK